MTILTVFKSVDDFDAVARSIEKTTGSLGKLSSVGKTLTVGVTAPIVAIGAAALGAAAVFDDAMDTIRQGTGATGAELNGLGDSFRTVLSHIPVDAGAAATAIADLNTRTGATGPALEGLAAQFLNLSRITGDEVAPLIASTTRLFGDWSVATDEQASAMDLLWKVSQSTGAEFGSLSEKLVQFGAPLRQMGFSLEESAALMGKWEQEGVNSELVLGSLRIAIGQFADAGIPMREGLDDTIAKIQALGPGSAATALAIETFGKRAGPDMAAAILEGRFQIDALLDTLDGSGETIQKAAADTDGFAEQWKLVKNNLMIALEPLGTRLLKVLEDLTPLLITGATAIAKVGEKFGDLSPTAQKIILVVGGVVAAIGPLLVAFASIGSAVVTILPWLPALGTAIGVLTGPVGLVVAAVVGLVVAWRNWSTITAIVRGVYTAAREWLVDKFQGIVDSIKGKIDAVTGFFSGMYNKIVGNSFVPDMIAKIGEQFGQLNTLMVDPTRVATTTTEGLFATLLSNLTSTLPPGLQGLFGDLAGRAATFLSDFSGKWLSTFTSLFGDGSDGLQGIVSAGLTALGNLLFPGFGSLLAGLEPIITAGLQRLGGLFVTFFRTIWGWFRSLWGWISDIFGGDGSGVDDSTTGSGTTDDSGIDHPGLLDQPSMGFEPGTAGHFSTFGSAASIALDGHEVVTAAQETRQ